MFANFFVTALRNLVQHKLFSAINIGGLTLALMASMLILIFVKYETSFENWLPGSEQVFRAETDMVFPGREAMAFSYSPGPLKTLFEVEFSEEVRAATRVYTENAGVANLDRRFIERVAYVDENFFEVFEIKLVEGSGRVGIADNTSILISETMAEKYFFGENPIGKTLEFDNQKTFRVGGVFQNIPHNSHLDLNFLLRIDPLNFQNQPWVLERWGSVNVFTYFRLNEGVSIEVIQARMAAAIDRHVDLEAEQGPDGAPSDFIKIDFLPVSDIHLYASRTGDMKPGGNYTIVLAFATIAILILFIAGVNYTNLSTARALKRVSEIGIRKTLGASRSQLVKQFLAEAVLVALLALLGAFLLVDLTIPLFQGLFGQQFAEGWYTDYEILGYAFLSAVLVGLGGGIYPAVLLSALEPKTAMETPKGSKPMARNLLVGLQFAISIALIVMTTTVARQTEFAQTTDLGFATDNRIVMRGLMDQQARPLAETIRQEITRLPGVINAEFSHDTPPLRSDISTRVILNESQQEVILERVLVGPRFFEIYQIPTLAGREFDPTRPADFIDPALEGTPSFSVVVNRSALKMLGFSSPDEALGQAFKMEITETVMGLGTIVGVVEDIKLRSLHRPVTPLVFFSMNVPMNLLTVQIAPGEGQAETLSQIDTTWQEFAPEAYLSRTWLNENLHQQYFSEIQAASVFIFFAIFAILVSAMGLFGLVNYSTERRRKEIGIRKILGGKVFDIVSLFIWQFSKPVLFASLIGLPVSAYFAINWLQGFAYRIDIGIFEFSAAFFGALIVAWLAVGINAVQAAREKPITALRYE